MIHLALVVAAIMFLGWVAVLLFGLIAHAFSNGPGWGCLTLVLVVIAVVVVLAIAF
jgi:hypothetical protein